jgi:predicted RNase H-like HicB family nuclease
MNIHSRLTAVFEQHGDDYIAYIEEMPGVNTQGATIEEAKANLNVKGVVIRSSITF